MPDISQRLLSPREAAQVLGISTRTLWDLKGRGEIPCVKIGRSVRYARADIEAFIARNRQTTTDTNNDP